jgi:hypothetical protein
MTDRKLFHGLVPATALTALAIAGCGGGGGNSDASFISKVNAQCRTSQAQIDALGQPKNNSVTEVTTLLKSTLPIAQSEIAALKAISPPSDKKADYQAALANQDQSLALLQQAITAGEGGNAGRIKQVISQVAGLSAQGDALATKIGVSDCVSKNTSSSSSTGTTTT